MVRVLRMILEVAELFLPLEGGRCTRRFVRVVRKSARFRLSPRLRKRFIVGSVTGIGEIIDFKRGEGNCFCRHPWGKEGKEKRKGWWK